MAEQDLIERVREAWAEVLDTPPPPDDVRFFDAGGDSILLIVLLDRLGTMTDRVLEPPDLFQHSTIRAQAALLAGTGQPISAVARTPDRGGLSSRAQRVRPES